MTKRIFFIDFARSLAIILAILDHSMIDFKIWDYDTQIFVFIKTITTTATPIFLFLFGMILEIVHLKKLKNHGLKAVSSKLILRSFQCYIGFVLTVLAGYLGSVIAMKRAVGALLFLTDAHFGNILKLYTVLLLLAIPLIWIRLNKGLITVILMSLSYWILYPLFLNISPIQPNIDIFTSYIFGFGGTNGPSVLHSLSIVSVGMIVASFLSSNSKKFYFNSMYLLTVLIVIVSVSVLIVDPNEYLQKLITNIFRRANNPLYYLTGITYALIIALISSVLVPFHATGKRIHQFLVFGRSSLLAFTLCNIILNLGVKQFELYTWSMLTPIVLVIIIFSILKIFEDYIENISYGKYLDNIFAKISITFNRLYIDKFSNWITKILDNQTANKGNKKYSNISIKKEKLEDRREKVYEVYEVDITTPALKSTLLAGGLVVGKIERQRNTKNIKCPVDSLFNNK